MIIHYSELYSGTAVMNISMSKIGTGVSFTEIKQGDFKNQLKI